MTKRTKARAPRPFEVDDDDWYIPEWAPSSSSHYRDPFLPHWVPDDCVRSVPADAHWHAVRVPFADGQHALRALGTSIGPVIASKLAGHVTFLLNLHSLPSWNVIGTRLLRPGTMVEIPPAATTQGPDVHWLVLPGRGTTDPKTLQAALTGAPAAAEQLEPAGGRQSRAPRAAGPRS
ncbi:hypothetical protein CTZ27_29565 [Streptomyces griseocarneus]|nr:hypothetical protein CTZ27_29565 [Streptomyces griseocarneus]